MLAQVGTRTCIKLDAVQFGVSRSAFWGALWRG